MKYMGSKNRIAKYILPIILENRSSDQWYVEPFAGGMNCIDKVNGKRLANDISEPLISMWESIIYDDWKPLKFVSRELYNKVKDSPSKYKSRFVGWVGFNCSYSGKYFGGYAGRVKTKIGTIRNYQEEALRNTLRQKDSLYGVKLSNKDYRSLIIPPKSIIYCDIPYQNTTKYKTAFNHNEFWNWVRFKAKEGHIVFISEYNAPDDFKCVWEKQVSSSLSANGKIGGNKISTERLFTYIRDEY